MSKGDMKDAITKQVNGELEMEHLLAEDAMAASEVPDTYPPELLTPAEVAERVHAGSARRGIHAADLMATAGYFRFALSERLATEAPRSWSG